ncbi:hypothetical protein LTR84_001942 [Exophiala bonariae]|uniref:Methyltransferase domain-containing protein n=1 Tax=Exophiala bonariae TaxID=1690606 RepID=A0AAV9NBS6_9EURO|nr:hypothetical protein LTR84_001942 [Exophiala bonariae]
MVTNTTNHEADRPFLTRAYKLSGVDEARDLYNEWAATYDQDLADPSHDWVAPALTAAALLDFFSDANSSETPLQILDAGCGTGIVGAALALQTPARDPKINTDIDGIDLSTGMLDVARKTGAYRRLDTADMSGSLESIEDGSYDGVICVGVLTQGHVGPGVLREFSRLLKTGGCAAVTVREDIWESGGYKTVVEGLEKEGKIKVVRNTSEDSLRGASIKMKLLVLERL